MWVVPVLEVERIRTGEVNEDALSHSSTLDTSTHSESYYTPIELIVSNSKAIQTLCIGFLTKFLIKRNL